jgi:hypothetical protein
MPPLNNRWKPSCLEPVYFVGGNSFASFFLAGSPDPAASLQGQTPVFKPLIGAILPDVSGDIVAALGLAILLPIGARLIVGHFLSLIRDSRPQLRQVLLPFLNIATLFCSLALMIFALCVLPVGPAGAGLNPLADAKRELLEISSEASKFIDQAKISVATQPQSGTVAAYLETVAGRIRKINVESARATTTAPTQTSPQLVVMLPALLLALAGGVYAVFSYTNQRKKLNTFPTLATGRCENGDCENIQTKLAGLDNRVKFALIALHHKSHKWK